MLKPLVAQLKACPSRINRFPGTTLTESWERFKRSAWEHGREPTRAVFAGLVLHDDHIALLLTESERSQLAALANLALERYQKETNPPNNLGKTITASLTEL